MRTNILQNVWRETASRYTEETTLVTRLWEEVEREYSSTGRHYHTLAHLVYMVEKVNECHGLLDDPDIITFSIFYHDIVYDPARQDNEERSTEVARDRLTRLNVPADELARCEAQIVATSDHKGNGDPDTNYLLDIDLAILGEAPLLYEDYSRKIREEYAIYTDAEYNEGRTNVLRYFLGLERLFKTDLFYTRYEAQARDNLSSELRVLERIAKTDSES
ncbi:MAG: hypothetical protein KDD67_08500 [Ignavibacteriae bacterium]|nr:hypothetical protein [Ignavibacteriota bacterium]MCB9216707.1 hypothetical protein [Ignavibacteria bacterium]